MEVYSYRRAPMEYPGVIPGTLKRILGEETAAHGHQSHQNFWDQSINHGILNNVYNPAHTFVFSH
jgi:hypothetical protein